jgi:hypothetical protein
MEKALLSSNLLRFSFVKPIQPVFFQVTGKRSFAGKMSAAKEFPPEKVRAIVSEVASLLKERKESISVAETVGLLFLSRSFSFPSTSPTFYILLSSPREVGMLSPREVHSIPLVRCKEMKWRRRRDQDMLLIKRRQPAALSPLPFSALPEQAVSTKAA